MEDWISYSSVAVWGQLWVEVTGVLSALEDWTAWKDALQNSLFPPSMIMEACAEIEFLSVCISDWPQ